MILKRAALSFAFAATFCTSAFAGVVYDYHASMQSGAVFDGQVTLADDYQSVTAVDGYLTGADYGNDHLSWVWQNGENFADANQSTYGTFLMDGGVNSGYTYFLTYNFANAPSLVLSNVAYGNNVNYTDLVVSGTLSPVTNNVPEPATLGLMGLGLLGVVVKRRGKKQG